LRKLAGLFSRHLPKDKEEDSFYDLWVCRLNSFHAFLSMQLAKVAYDHSPFIKLQDKLE